MYKGIPASEGIAIGRVLLLEKEEPQIQKQSISAPEVSNQKQLLQEAIAKSKEQIQRIAASSGDLMKEILEAHLLMLEDMELIEAIHSKIENNLQDAASATEETVNFYAQMLSSLEDEYLKERGADMRDVGYRLLMNLLGKEIPSLMDLTEPVIVVAHDITPSDPDEKTNLVF